MYSSARLRNSNLALPSRIAERELPRTKRQNCCWLPRIQNPCFKISNPTFSCTSCFDRANEPNPEQNRLMGYLQRQKCLCKQLIYSFSTPFKWQDIFVCRLQCVLPLTRRVELTIELWFGQNASTDRKPVLPVADMESRDGRVVRHLGEGKTQH